MWFRRILFMVLTLLGCSVVATRTSQSGGDDWSTFDKKTFRVIHVADGDTIDIAVQPSGKTTRVRLLGIDAPELHRDGIDQPDFFAEKSRKYLLTRAKDRSVVVRLEQHQTRDRFGRLLAYIYLSDTENLNLALIRDGQAYADRRFQYSLQAQFEQTETASRKKKIGLWKDVAEFQMPAWRQEWLARQRGKKQGASRTGQRLDD